MSSMVPAQRGDRGLELVADVARELGDVGEPVAQALRSSETARWPCGETSTRWDRLGRASSFRPPTSPSANPLGTPSQHGERIGVATHAAIPAEDGGAQRRDDRGRGDARGHVVHRLQLVARRPAQHDGGPGSRRRRSPGPRRRCAPWRCGSSSSARATRVCGGPRGGRFMALSPPSARATSGSSPMSSPSTWPLVATTMPAVSTNPDAGQRLGLRLGQGGVERRAHGGDPRRRAAGRGRAGPRCGPASR